MGTLGFRLSRSRATDNILLSYFFLFCSSSLQVLNPHARRATLMQGKYLGQKYGKTKRSRGCFQYYLVGEGVLARRYAARETGKKLRRVE